MTQIIFERRYNFDDYEQIATYDIEEGELDGDEDFIEFFGHLFEEERFDRDTILERFDGPNLLAFIPENGNGGERGEPEGNEVEASASESPDVVSLEKYRVYLGEAETVSEAEEMAPEGANVQVGTQGGFYYDTESLEGGETDEKTPEGLVDGEVDDGGFSVDRSVDPTDVEEGDMVYVSHPNSPNYIADVEEVRESNGSWSIDFGGGSYTLREDTNSTYEGLVDETPELGDQEELESVTDATNLDEGDVVAYEDPAGYRHFTEVNFVDAGGLVQTPAGDLNEGEIDGKVVIDDPLEHYDIPTTDEIEENTNISDPEAGREFVEDVAKALDAGDATSVSCREYQFYVGAIQSEELMIEVFRSAVRNDASATHRDKIESRMRSMGLEPEEYHPGEIEYNPDEVPPERQDTKFSSFDSERATQTMAYVVQDNTISKRNEMAWHDFLDTMTEAELEEAVIKSVSNNVEKEGWGDNDPMDYEDANVIEESAPPNLSVTELNNTAAMISRIGRGDPERQIEVYERVKEEMPDIDAKDEMGKVFASFCQSAEARREIFNREDLPMDYGNQRFAMQFAEDHEQRAEAFIDRYVGSTSSQDTKHARAALGGYEANEGTGVSRFNNGLATDHIEPTEEFAETIDTLREQSAEYIEEEHDGEVVLKRGLDAPITSNTTAESWTDDHNTANSFDGHAIMEAVFEPGDVIACHEIEEHYDMGYSTFSSENEWTVLGGPLAEAIPDDMSADEYFEEVGASFDPMVAEETADVNGVET